MPGFLFGLGTVLDAQTARDGIESGAKFIVTPAVKPEVIAVCREKSIPVFGGALTPTEIITTWEAGADAVKIFPAEFFGPRYLNSIRAPFPNIKLVPTGGVTPETIGDFLKAGAWSTGAGSAMVDSKTLAAKDWATIRSRAKAFADAVAAASR
jgi:2-dehydro-3-deoxyphosphogluconate aldolase/(4S)-4-hydroxy-2-oxoglutarate aldolase